MTSKNSEGYEDIYPNGGILEFKTSPDNRYIQSRIIKDHLRNLRALWIKDEPWSLPPNFSFIFPQNSISEEAKEILEKFSSEYPEVKISWFEKDDMTGAYSSLGIFSEEDMYNYIKNFIIESGVT